jgi:cephalosporin-C deacetylase-like acetyl esterase
VFGDVMFEKYLAHEVAGLRDRFLGGAATLAEWKAKRAQLRTEFLDMIGLWPLPGKTPLNATTTGSIEREDFVVEKLHYQSRPGLYVTANLWRPRVAKEKLPAVLLFVGHYDRGRNGHKTFMQDQGKWFARNGYVCLIMDTLTRGELPGIHHGLYARAPKPGGERMWWISRGYSPAGVECWNAIRGIDYLTSRPEVDAGRIAATGLSGGGAVTFWISAADDRVKVAAAHSGLTDWESLVLDRILRLHCDCMVPYNTKGWELTTVGALIAPTPFLFVNCDDDLGFPMAANHRIAERLKRIYRIYNREDHFQEYVTHGPVGAHSYTPDSRMAIFRWINIHLKKDSGPVTDVDDVRFPEEDLRTFPTNADIPRGVVNDEIDQTFVPVGQVRLPSRAQFDSWRHELVSKVRMLSFRTFPERIPPADKAPRPNRYRFVEWEREEGVQVWKTESGIVNYIALHGIVSNEPPRKNPVTLFVLNDGESLSGLPEWAVPLITGEPYAILAPRGVGATAWTPESANYMSRAHLCIGRTIDQGRVWDIAAIARHLNGDGPIKVAGRGQSGILGAYAALFEPSIREVVVVGPPASHAEGPAFLNVLRVLDVPEALGLLAPRTLTLVNAGDATFDRTRAIYECAGAGYNLRRV